MTRKKRSLFRELMSAVEAMWDHREGRLTLMTREVQAISVPPIDAGMVRETSPRRFQRDESRALRRS